MVCERHDHDCLLASARKTATYDSGVCSSSLSSLARKPMDVVAKDNDAHDDDDDDGNDDISYAAAAATTSATTATNYT